MQLTQINFPNGIEQTCREGFTVPSPIIPCCGPGSGWLEKVVPESILGICLTPACSVHDDMFKNADGGLLDFLQSNFILFWNICKLSKLSAKWFALFGTAVVYSVCVCILGFPYYKTLHSK